MINSKFKKIAFWVILAGLLTSAVWLAGPRFWQQNKVQPQTFDGKRAFQDVEYQVSAGPRIPDSPAHTEIRDWIRTQLQSAGWSVELQETTSMGHPVQNIVARWGEGQPWVVLGAHYDTRMAADQDPNPNNRTQPVPGANDGASGVAVLLEMARILPAHLGGSAWAKQVWLVFFDAEDNGNLPGWDWILGSQAFVSGLEGKPDAAVIIDMIGDSDLNIYQEYNSDPGLTQEIWAQAQLLGYGGQFIPRLKHRMIDDHTPFLKGGIPAVDIIDFDYPYWHTIADTPDKVSASSLQAVGDTLLAWLSRQP